MRLVGLILLAVILAVAAFAIWVRVAPYDASRWHRAAESRPVGDYPAPGAFEAVRRPAVGVEEALHAIDAIAMSTPRTRRVSGAPDTGMMTYETRTARMGFPDYTTVSVVSDGAEPLVSIRGRLRFGQADMGVNVRRIRDWLSRLDGVLVPLDAG